MLEESGDVDIRREVRRTREIRRALRKVQEAQEILAGLAASDEITVEDVLLDRADAFGASLTDTELEVMSRFVEGQAPETIAEERSLSERTVDNQLRSAGRKLGFRDRREMRGWSAAISRLILTRQPNET